MTAETREIADGFTRALDAYAADNTEGTFDGDDELPVGGLRVPPYPFDPYKHLEFKTENE